jgi:hypothetical protein
MRSLLPALLGALVVVVLVATGLETPQRDAAATDHEDPLDSASPWFEVYHYDSQVQGRQFREVFLVHALSPGWTVATVEVVIERDGKPLEVVWEDQDGLLGLEDRFWFDAEAFDAKSRLTGVVAGVTVMECRFGGGAGVSIHPDEWRAMGMPEEVRCLQRTDDQ